MPIGVDGALPARSGSRRSPLSMPGGMPSRPPMVNDSAVQAQQNNLMAAGAGSGRVAMQSMDRAGISRGKGHQARAQMAEAMSQANANTSSAEVGQNAANANAAAQVAYEGMVKGENINNAGLLEGLRNTQAMNRLSRAGLGMDRNETIRRGQLGLDSIYLDKTPLLQALLR